MIQLKDGIKQYPGSATRALDGIQLDVKKGDFLYVIGGSGAGKSSLLRILGTEESLTRGHLSLFGYSLASLSPSTLRAIRQAIGVVPQNPRLIPDLTVRENVEVSLWFANSRANRNALQTGKVKQVLEAVSLDHKSSHFARELSGGEAQRVAVARALVREPELILADEPTGSQDGELCYRLLDLFLKAGLGGATVLLATHDREMVRRVRKKSVVLRDGKLSLEYKHEDLIYEALGAHAHAP